MKFTIATFSSLLTLVASHGIIVNPPARAPGPAFKEACGEQAYSVASKDPYGPIQLWQSVMENPTPACDFSSCKSLKLADSPAPLAWAPGSVVPIQIDIKARHTGYAKVEIIDLKTGLAKGKPLFYWEVYAGSTEAPPAANETDFSVTIPEVHGCEKAGDCALQWWVSAAETTQTYVSCVDFVQPKKVPGCMDKKGPGCKEEKPHGPHGPRRE
ncbi:hypothetical protein BJ508DRAFT_244891 [Ascobolus immersus RN42]|uniref:Chitin-binding type-4 domain-containing protein n=1 Tax=Ascobolus immersus RN42 TaxID=1160509 RepID=A0A3N4HDF7_ASCIM|nr:hypothetical protein BJ508DRAFT_244891 [Ascobolus immersus RN42]